MARKTTAAECHPDRPLLARSMCGTCYRWWWNQQNPGGAKRIRENRPRATECEHTDRPALARGMCGTCYRRVWRAENPERQRLSQRKYQQSRRAAMTTEEKRNRTLKRYGLTVDDFERMAEEQDGRCAACGGECRRLLQVDHCHETGQVRGLLCENCNSALGHAKDDITRLRSLIRYLQRAQAPEDQAR